MKELFSLAVCSLTFVFCSAVHGVTITTTLDTTIPPAGPGYTRSTGQQTGRLNRNTVPSNCDAPKSNPGLILSSTNRQYDSYVFFAPPLTGCVAVTLVGGANNIFVAVYNSSGFVPASPSTNYLADPGSSPNPDTVTYFFNVIAGQQFTVVVSEIDPGGGVGTNYTLTVDPVVPQTISAALDDLPPPSTTAYAGGTGTQMQRLEQDGVASSCSAVKPNPGLANTTTGIRQWDSYTFVASRTGCVTVTLQSQVPNNLFSASYNSAVYPYILPTLNYLADAGSGNPSVKYSFRVVAGEPFTVVVHAVQIVPVPFFPYTLLVSEAISQTPFNFDGDNRTDIGIFRPAGGVSEWWINRSSTGATFALQFGASTDKIVPADYTGDAKDDLAVWRPSTGEWFVLRSEDFSFFALPFGTNGDIPAPADYDADGKADFAVFRPTSALWFISQSIGGPTRIFQFGVNGDQPVVSDYDGDGRADIAIFRPGPREWWIQRTMVGPLALQFGNTGDKAVPGDYTGDRRTDIAIWRPSTGQWFIIRSGNFSFYGFPFGANGDIPAPGDYDGDGIFDPTVFRPSNATWYIARTSAATQIVQFGASGDRPIANAFVP